MDKKNICFIINPVSGVSHKNDLADLIQEKLDHKKFNYRVKYTGKAGEAITIAEKSLADNFDVIVAVGGDGTINEIVRSVRGTNCLLGIIPNGSGNGLARHLGIPLNAGKALQLINELYSTQIDVATINEHPFVSIAGLGFDAKVAHNYQKFGKRGFFGYFRVILTQFFRYKSREFDLVIEKETHRRKAMLVSLANSNQFGYGTIIAPDASLTDGLLDIVLVQKFPAWEVPLIMHKTFRNKINQSKYVETLHASELVIYRDKGKRVNIDGEAVKMGKRLEIKVHPLSLNIIIPKNNNI